MKTLYASQPDNAIIFFIILFRFFFCFFWIQLMSHNFVLRICCGTVPSRFFFFLGDWRSALPEHVISLLIANGYFDSRASLGLINRPKSKSKSSSKRYQNQAAFLPARARQMKTDPMRSDAIRRSWPGVTKNCRSFNDRQLISMLFSVSVAPSAVSL